MSGYFVDFEINPTTNVETSKCVVETKAPTIQFKAFSCNDNCVLCHKGICEKCKKGYELVKQIDLSKNATVTKCYLPVN